ncbi:uncharacterized protein LOC130915120 isoform X2 [Corythoichthys intestinalis]|nr:uncharacterized protein LOC130915120 isoform X2 [Corythoichthys intestinalis]
MRRKPALVRPTKTSNVSLHQRFSQVMIEQMTRPSMMAFPQPQLLFVASPIPFVPQMGVPCPAPSPAVRTFGRANVWSRLGRERSGYWNFRTKYGWRARCRTIRLRRAALFRRTARLRRAGGSAARRPDTSGELPDARPEAGRRPWLRRQDVPTKRQLDMQLDRYMSRSKSRLDAQLDDYMARSKKRLDADLDEYMSRAGCSSP